MKIAIIGASGFIGSAITKRLLAESKHSLVLFSHNAEKLHYSAAHERRITHIDGDILKPDDINDALQNCDMVIYLVHLMGNRNVGRKFVDAEAQAAKNLIAAIRAHDIRRVIYVGGMASDSGPQNAKLTNHLQSRRATGDILRAGVPQLIEFRTPMVVGKGGAGFDVLVSLVDRLPVFPVPRWARAVTQPISVHDVARYLMTALTMSQAEHISVAIGGPEQLSYVDVAKRYAAYKHKTLWVINVPFISKRFSAAVLRLNKHNASFYTVADMVASAGYSTVLQDDQARQLFPDVVPEPIERAF